MESRCTFEMAKMESPDFLLGMPFRVQNEVWAKRSMLAWQQQVKFNATGFDSDLQKELFVLRDSL